MSETSTQPLERSMLEQQLKRAQQAQRKLLELNEVNQRQIRGLVECVHHLSISCKGQNLELDNRLAKLRSRLASEKQVDALLPELAALCRTLQSQAQHSQREVKGSQEAMASLAKRLTQLADLPEGLQRELTFFQQEMKKPVYSIWEHLPQLRRLVGYYEALLSERLASNTPLEVSPKHQQMAHELAQLLSELEFRPENRSTIAAVKAELAGEIGVESLLDAYQQVLDLLTGEIVREKNSSQQFLFAINDALNVVREAVSDNWNLTVRNFGNQRELNRKLSSQCNALGDSVANATELEQLKQHVSKELAQLRGMLEKREQEDQREFMKLKESMEQMRKELSAITNEASSYKEKLVEQQRLNMLDALTQLPNRAALEDRLKREYRNVRRYGSKLWVAVVDIDHFKSINDNFGHTTGDKTLQVIAMALKNALRKEEFVARYGGEEFVLLLPEVDEEHVALILNRTRERIKAIPFKFRNDRLTVTISVGAALVAGNETIQETFERADAALYRAKRQGRDRVEIDN
ncbi:GGDEF domain-containing protein [Ferrimonas marina]|uniref:diguanylate cyclase n=1 Tax=Ferrimonas marina TaxID=299255 RepID=A0A1M5SAX2_9GAMM|nr:GGDEF domain-containing protein [Ferrimonas marina]SHH35646.1 diguanylate cyclase (GGDEF) domain-containing protein [Ferrimonas marina]